MSKCSCELIYMIAGTEVTFRCDLAPGHRGNHLSQAPVTPVIWPQLFAEVAL